MKKIKKYDFIKEIRIDAYSGYFVPLDEKCEEILKISSNWISFKRIKARSLAKELGDDEDIKWDYKTNNPSFEEKYESLCETLLDYNRDSTLRMLDTPGFNITIVFNGKEKIEYHYDGNVNDQEDIGLRRIANEILDLIPSGEFYPECLKHQEPSDVDWSVVESIVKELEKNPKIEIKFPEEETKPGTIQIGYPDYPEWVYVITESYVFEPDFNYDENYKLYFGEKELEDINVDELDFNKIRTLITLFSRQERFCDGFMKKYIENGCLLKWLKKALTLFANN